MNLKSHITRAAAVYLPLSLSLLSGCETDTVETEEDDIPKLEVYYSLQNSSEKYSLNPEDTFSANLGDTLSISVHYTGGEFLGLSADGLELIDEGSGEYTCVVSKTGSILISIFLETDEATGSTVYYDDIIFVYYILEVPTSKYLLVIASEPEITIEPDDDVTTVNSILAELESDFYLPGYLSVYTLTTRTLYGGDLIFRTVDEDSISGTFTCSDVRDLVLGSLTDITMNYNDREYAFTMAEDNEANFINGCLLKLDLTHLFEDRYPNVDEVSVKATALKNNSPS